jgi:hypothetical protein
MLRHREIIIINRVKIMKLKWNLKLKDINKQVIYNF